MKLPANKTRIVCTIGPASSSPEVMRVMIRSGMDIARLNFSHGDFAGHRQVIENLRAAARAEGRRLAIMADLPGPKMRIGQLAEELVTLQAGGRFTLSTEDIVGDAGRASGEGHEVSPVSGAGRPRPAGDGTGRPSSPPRPPGAGRTRR